MQPKLRVLLSTTLLVLFSFLSVFAIGQTTLTYSEPNLPTVTSDKADYAPGEVAHITGSGWVLDKGTKGVYVDITEDPWFPDMHTFWVDVDDNGNWSLNFPIELRHLGVKFTVTARGLESKYSVQTTFTDKGDPTVLIVSSSNPSGLNESVTFTVTVMGVGGVTPTGNVDFKDGNSNLALNVSLISSSSGVATATYTTSVLTPGTHNINVKYGGDGNYNQKSTTLSQVVSNKQNQTITFNAVPNKTYGDPDFDPGATASSGLAVTYTSSNANVATITAGGLIHIVGAGQTIITASQAGNNNYNAASSETQELTVIKAPATVTLTGLTGQKYTGSALAAGATTNATGTSTFTFVYTKDGSPIDANQVVNAGSYGVTATLVNDNFSGSNTGTLVIGRAASTIEVTGSTTFTYAPATAQGPSTSTVTGSTGAVSYSYTGTSNGGAVYAASATKPTLAGSYSVKATVAQDDNYEAKTSEAFSFTIGRAASTVTTTVGTYTYNKAPQGPSTGTKAGSTATVTYSYSGTSNGNVAYGPSSTKPTLAGSYSVVATVAQDDNYNGASDTDPFTIDKAVPTITAAAATDLVYNNTEKAGTGSATGVEGASDVLTPAVTFSYVGTGATVYPTSATAPKDAGTYSMTVNYAGNDNYTSGSKTIAFTVLPQTAIPMGDAFYTGSKFFWTTGPNSSTATLTLSATLKNSVNYSGNIRTAKVSFFLNGNPITGAQNLPVGLVNPDDESTGTAAVNVQYNLGSATAEIVHITVKITGNYSHGIVVDDEECMIAVPVPGGQIVGGGKINNTNSSGYVKGADNRSTGFSFFVKYNSSLRNPQGGVEFTVKSYYDRTGKLTQELHIYKFKSNAISTLSVQTPKATFTGKANVSEIVNGVEQSIEGNCTIQMEVNDVAVDGTGDLLAVTIYRSKGGVWFSSNWDGKNTITKAIKEGNICVTGAGSTIATQQVVTQARQAEVIEPVSREFQLKAFPNPSVSHFNVQVSSDKVNEKINVRVLDLYGRTVEVIQGVYSGQTLKLGGAYRPGIYFVEMIQGTQRQQIKVMKQGD